MSKGIKMRSAVDAKSTRHTVDSLQSQYDNGQTIPSLLCEGANCGMPVRFVKQHSQNRKDRLEPVHIPAYIGLSRGSDHVTGCRYDAPGRLQRILAAASDPMFMRALASGKRELRLLILHRALEKGGGASSNASVPSQLPTGGSAHQRPTLFQPTGQQLDNYLRTTLDLLTLRAACEDDALLSKHLTLKFGKQKVRWNQFLFEAGRYDEAWDKLDPVVNYRMPMALVGTVKSHVPPPTGTTYLTTYLNCEPQENRTSTPDTREYFEISIRHDEEAWLNTFPVGTQIVMFGLWQRNTLPPRVKPHKDGGGRTITYITHKLSLSPSFKGQLAVIV